METGTIIWGTLNPRDLIPAFLSALDCADWPSDLECIARDLLDLSGYEKAYPGPYSVGWVSDGALEEYLASEECSWDLEDIQDRLREKAPYGFHFGDQDGDGSHFGFWSNLPDWINENLGAAQCVPGPMLDCEDCGTLGIHDTDAPEYQEACETDGEEFSFADCDCCGTSLGGSRYAAHIEWTKGEWDHASICADCVVYLANGDLPGC